MLWRCATSRQNGRFNLGNKQRLHFGGPHITISNSIVAWSQECVASLHGMVGGVGLARVTGNGERFLKAAGSVTITPGTVSRGQNTYTVRNSNGIGFADKTSAMPAQDQQKQFQTNKIVGNSKLRKKVRFQLPEKKRRRDCRADDVSMPASIEIVNGPPVGREGAIDIPIKFHRVQENKLYQSRIAMTTRWDLNVKIMRRRIDTSFEEDDDEDEYALVPNCLKCF